MPKRLLNKHFAWATVVMVAFIVYGSLFPFDFHGRAGADPLAALLTTWRFRPEHFGNLIGNIFLYMPLGLFGVLAMGSRISSYVRLCSILLTGAVLCFSLELIQFYDTGRVTTFADIYPNIFGTGVGTVAGLFLGADFRWPLKPALRAQPIPVLLLCAFLGYRLFPYIPSLDLHQYWQALKPVLLHPQLDAYAIARYTMIWLVVAALGQTLVGAAPARWLLAPAMFCVLGAKVAITNNSVSAAEVAAVATAFGCWLALGQVNAKTHSLWIAMALAALIVAERLQPFYFVATGNTFGWVPFLSFMQGSMAVNTQSFLEKFFLYGSLIYLLTRTGAGLGVAGFLAALGLLATSLMQTHLPGRSAEITDAVMALIIAGVFGLITRTLTTSTQTRRPGRQHPVRDRDDEPSLSRSTHRPRHRRSRRVESGRI